MALADDSLARTAFVADCGSSLLKAGLAHESAPETVISTVVGRPKGPPALTMEAREYYVGPEAEAKKGLVWLKRPVEGMMLGLALNNRDGW